MGNGRCRCPCDQQVLEVYVNGRKTALDWPWSPAGDIAVEHSITGSYHARYVPVGEDIAVTEHRYRRHDCGEPVPSITEPLRATDAA